MKQSYQYINISNTYDFYTSIKPQNKTNLITPVHVGVRWIDI